jgi:hypothetical protein
MERRSWNAAHRLHPHALHRVTHQVTLTGRTRPYFNRFHALVGRSTRVSREYRCTCGHVGWSNHADLERRAGGGTRNGSGAALKVHEGSNEGPGTDRPLRDFVFLRDFRVPRRGGAETHCVVLSEEGGPICGLHLHHRFTCGPRTFQVRGFGMPNPRPENELWVVVHEET